MIEKDLRQAINRLLGCDECGLWRRGCRWVRMLLRGVRSLPGKWWWVVVSVKCACVFLFSSFLLFLVSSSSCFLSPLILLLHITAPQTTTTKTLTSRFCKNRTVSNVFWISGILSFKPPIRRLLLASMNWYFLMIKTKIRWLILFLSFFLLHLHPPSSTFSLSQKLTESSPENSSKSLRRLRESKHNLPHDRQRAHREFLVGWWEHLCCSWWWNVWISFRWLSISRISEIIDSPSTLLLLNLRHIGYR